MELGRNSCTAREAQRGGGRREAARAEREEGGDNIGRQ